MNELTILNERKDLMAKCLDTAMDIWDQVFKGEGYYPGMEPTPEAIALITVALFNDARESERK